MEESHLLLQWRKVKTYYIFCLLATPVWFLLSILSIGEKETQMTGVYDLVAVLTHKGRSADSGHYVGWVKQENGWFLETELCLSGICLSVIINHYIYYCYREMDRV
jgi:hypothetical protein